MDDGFFKKAIFAASFLFCVCHSQFSQELDFRMRFTDLKAESQVVRCSDETDREILIHRENMIYIVSGNHIFEIPVKKGNTENIKVECDNNEIRIQYKRPLSNLFVVKVYEMKDSGPELKFSQEVDEYQTYFDELFDDALFMSNNRIAELELKKIPFVYQYINNEKLHAYYLNYMEKTKNLPLSRKEERLEKFGILTTKLILFYYQNKKDVSREELEDYRNWIQAWEYIAYDGYQAFLVEYAKILLNTNTEKGIEVLLALKKHFPESITPDLVLADHLWEKSRKKEAKKLYREILSMYEKNGENLFYNTEIIPEYVFKRLEE